MCRVSGGEAFLLELHRRRKEELKLTNKDNYEISFSVKDAPPRSFKDLWDVQRRGLWSADRPAFSSVRVCLGAESPPTLVRVLSRTAHRQWLSMLEVCGLFWCKERSLWPASLGLELPARLLGAFLGLHYGLTCPSAQSPFLPLCSSDADSNKRTIPQIPSQRLPLEYPTRDKDLVLFIIGAVCHQIGVSCNQENPNLESDKCTIQCSHRFLWVFLVSRKSQFY